MWSQQNCPGLILRSDVNTHPSEDHSGQMLILGLNGVKKIPQES